MYIGPWQEFKLAKILQLKDKVDKEINEANRLEYGQQPRGAYSHQNGPTGNLRTMQDASESYSYMGAGSQQPMSAYNAIPTRNDGDSKSL